jgi:hypothetical protein
MCFPGGIGLDRQLTSGRLDDPLVGRYAFDRVFAKDTTQDEVFNDTAKPLLPGLFDGFNATVFAYGVSAGWFCQRNIQNLWFLRC